jgi:hypothetical protein
MTQQEFKAMKFRVKDPEHSKQIQEKLFEMGYKWWCGQTVKEQDAKFLYAKKDGNLGYGIDMYYFKQDSSKESILQNGEFIPIEQANVIQDNYIDGGETKESFDMVNLPKHYQLFPEYNLEVKDINKRLLDNIEKSDFEISLYAAGWYQQAMQYFLRFYEKGGLEDLKKGINTMGFVVSDIEERAKKTIRDIL